MANSTSLAGGTWVDRFDAIYDELMALAEELFDSFELPGIKDSDDLVDNMKKFAMACYSADHGAFDEKE